MLNEIDTLRQKIHHTLTVTQQLLQENQQLKQSVATLELSLAQQVGALKAQLEQQALDFAAQVREKTTQFEHDNQALRHKLQTTRTQVHQLITTYEDAIHYDTSHTERSPLLTA